MKIIFALFLSLIYKVKITKNVNLSIEDRYTFELHPRIIILSFFVTLVAPFIILLSGVFGLYKVYTSIPVIETSNNYIIRKKICANPPTKFDCYKQYLKN